MRLKRADYLQDSVAKLTYETWENYHNRIKELIELLGIRMDVEYGYGQYPNHWSSRAVIVEVEHTIPQWYQVHRTKEEAYQYAVERATFFWNNIMHRRRKENGTERYK